MHPRPSRYQRHRPHPGRRAGPAEVTVDLVERVKAVMAGQPDLDLIGALALVSDDAAAPIETRLQAVRRLSGALFGKLWRTHMEQFDTAPAGAPAE